MKPKHPDFKGKVGGGLSLWLNDAPDWVLQKLNELEFDVFLPKGKLKQLKGSQVCGILLRSRSPQTICPAI